MATIEFDGKDIPVPELGFASEATLRRLAGMGGQSAGSIGNLGKSSNTTAQKLDNLRRKTDDLEKKMPGVTTGFDLLGGAITGTAGLLKGIMNASGKFSDLNPVIDFTTDKLAGLASMVPFVGGFLASLAEAGGEIAKFKLEVMDMTLNTFQGLQELGVQFNTQVGTTDDLIQSIFKSQITLTDFANVTAQNLEGMVAFGGATDLGARKFLRNIDVLTDPLSETGMQLRSMGLDSAAITEAFGDFIQSNRYNSKMMMMTEEQLRGQLVQRIKNERLITELTGIDVKEQRARLNQQMEDAGLQAALMDMNAESARQAGEFAMTLNGPLKSAFIGALTPFGTANEEALKMIGFLPEVGSTLQSIATRLKNGDITAAEARAELNSVLGEATKNQKVQNLLLIDAARGTNEFSNFLGDAFMEGRKYTNQLELINQSTGKNFKTQDEAAQYFLDQVGVSAEEFENAMRKVKGVLNEKDLEDMTKMDFDERMDFLKNVKGLDTETGNTLAAVAAIQDEFLALTQAQIIQKVGGDLEGMAILLGKAYNTLSKQFGLNGEVTLDMAANDLKIDLVANNANLNFGISNAVGNATYNKLQGGGDLVYEKYQEMKEKKNNFAGGNLFPGMLSMVGEMGPELIKSNSTGEVINSATSSDIMSAANAVVNNLGNNGGGYSKATVDLLSSIAKDQADTKKLLARILPKAMTGNGYF